ncbi:MAG: fungal specific transcription factor domain-containing protein [Bacteroidia bacterium]|nr:fungal specific transcription factor domain-containing protein [Bacteroidia bacterium]
MEADEKMINQVLAEGDVVMHHSKYYEETYHPHYRIVHRSVFERWKGKYLNK